MAAGSSRRVVVAPVTPGRWRDLARLFGPRGACAGCWCMWPRLSRREFAAGKGAGNRRALRRLVAAGGRPGLIAYVGGEPAGWCALAPRAAYKRFERSRILKPVDERSVWSAPCLFVARPHRRRGLTVELLRAAVRHARTRGAEVVEGYPIEAEGKRLADAFAWFGLAAAFRAAGFREVARRSPARPIVRYELRRKRGTARAAPAPTRATRPAARRG